MNGADYHTNSLDRCRDDKRNCLATRADLSCRTKRLAMSGNEWPGLSSLTSHTLCKPETASALQQSCLPSACRTQSYLTIIHCHLSNPLPRPYHTITTWQPQSHTQVPNVSIARGYGRTAHASMCYAKLSGEKNDETSNSLPLPLDCFEPSMSCHRNSLRRADHRPWRPVLERGPLLCTDMETRDSRLPIASTHNRKETITRWVHVGEQRSSNCWRTCSSSSQHTLPLSRYQPNLRTQRIGGSESPAGIPLVTRTFRRCVSRVYICT